MRRWDASVTNSSERGVAGREEDRAGDVSEQPKGRLSPPTTALLRHPGAGVPVTTSATPGEGTGTRSQSPPPGRRLSVGRTPSPLMTSCRSISLWLSPATTSLPTVCCQFWASGSGSRSDSWPRSSSSRCGRRASVQNPRLGDSMLLRGEGQLREEEECTQRLVRPACPMLGGNHQPCRRVRTPNRPLGAGRLTHLRPILGVKGGVGFSRDLWRKSALSTHCPKRAPSPRQAAQTLPTWWRGWRQRRRRTGGDGQLLRPRPCPRRCESAARSPPSVTASSPPGPSGSQSGPGGSLSGSWGAGQETQRPTAWTAYTCDPDSGVLYPQRTGPELPSDNSCCCPTVSVQRTRDIWAQQTRLVLCSAAEDRSRQDSCGPWRLDPGPCGGQCPLPSALEQVSPYRRLCWRQGSPFLGFPRPSRLRASLLTGRPGTTSTRCWPPAPAAAQGLPLLPLHASRLLLPLPGQAGSGGGGPASDGGKLCPGSHVCHRVSLGRETPTASAALLCVPQCGSTVATGTSDP